MEVVPETIGGDAFRGGLTPDIRSDPDGRRLKGRAAAAWPLNPAANTTKVAIPITGVAIPITGRALPSINKPLRQTSPEA
jgi:hypothetical protein